MRYDRRVALQAAVKSQDSYGEETRVYSTVPGLEDIPAAVVAMSNEERRAEMTVVADRYTILLSGSHPDITTEMVVLDDQGGVYDVLGVQPSFFRRHTLVQAQNLYPSGVA